MDKNLIIPIKNSAVQIFDNGGMPAVIAAIKSEVSKPEHTPDLTTDKGRKAVASLAAKVGSSKVFLDNLGKDLADAERKRIDGINVIRKDMREELDALKVLVRKPLTDWEVAERQEQAAIQKKMELLKTASSQLGIGSTSADVLAILEQVKAVEVDDSFGDFIDKAAALKEMQIENLETLHATTVQSEKDATELEQLRNQQANSVEQKKAELLERSKTNMDILLTLAGKCTPRATKAELVSALVNLRQTDPCEDDFGDVAENAAQVKDAAIANAEALLELIVEQEKTDAAEIDRLAREKDRKHKGGINKAVVACLMKACKLSEADAKAVATAIVKKQISHVSVNY